MIEWVLDPVVALNLRHLEFLWQGTGIDRYSERRVGSVYQIVNAAGDSSFEGIYHNLHLLLHRLHLHKNRWRGCIREREHAQVPLFRSVGLVTALWPFGSSSLGTVTLVFLLNIVSCVSLT